ncbi:helix-turn-helix domain-containing protein [Streptomyces sp. NPDC002680]|uniref:helix-turn-helix domain-containing protein n=1 Tax=Streptomyces sp. NPDC002680 TaxID=3364659 RepID=UPI0036B1F641
MPARHFDRDRARRQRRAAEISQSEVAAGVGVSDSAVANWEAGHASPDPEKLPAYATALRGDLDDLFPRVGLPDLADLRCDASLYQYETAEVIGTKSTGPVKGAERGDRRLKDKYVTALAARYGVSETELRRAEDRSMAAAEARRNGMAGEPERLAVASADGNGPPTSLAGKITMILQHSYPGPQGPPSDAEMAAEVNARLGVDVLTEQDFEDLRTGAEGTPSPGVLDALAAVVGVSEMYFKSDEAVAAQVYEGLQLLAAAKAGTVGRVRARGLGAEGLPPLAMAFVNDLVAEMKEKKEKEAGSGT